jgi:hypothetical protein
MRPMVDQVKGAVRRWRGVSVGESRRYNVATQERWRPRAEAAVELLLAVGPRSRPGQLPLRVSDFGAGNEVVGELLAERAPYPFAYNAYDLHPQKSSTTRLDVREGLPAAPADVAFALGLIEYLPDSAPILQRLAAHAAYVALSYVPLDDARRPVAERAQLGWVRHQTDAQIEEAVAHAGLVELGRRSADGGETCIRFLRSSARQPADASSA